MLTMQCSFDLPKIWKYVYVMSACLRKTDARNALRTRFRLPMPLLLLRCAALVLEFVAAWLQQNKLLKHFCKYNPETIDKAPGKLHT